VVKGIWRFVARLIFDLVRRSPRVVEPAECNFNFEMHVVRLKEPPRITAPFSDEEWKKLEALGERVDEDLAHQDVRLTMGGEPTFVSIDDFESSEWNTAAVGPTKKNLCGQINSQIAIAFRARRLSSLWTGKMVSGRKPSTMGFCALLAQRRSGNME